ncbi:hypothetical protein AVEN_157085-1 [Araneus ventricosus]|uniref:Uncharacterized protein n=1 Tax=Araneus ventricosus TaxID=182803 RepID=A0A4Y2J4W9_ARAVE|nr:hypothetical protein AVEN_157085-1 [Araneus ventricosus]
MSGPTEVQILGYMNNTCHLSKASHSQLSQNGIFGTREGKNNRQGRNPMKFGANDSKWWNSKELKQTIRISSKMEFLKQWKEKAIASFKNRWKLA